LDADKLPEKIAFPTKKLHQTPTQRIWGDRQTKRADELQTKAEQQYKRFDKLLDKWEEQARMQDEIVSAMEKQQSIKK
jgi:hypothetical protein